MSKSPFCSHGSDMKLLEFRRSSDITWRKDRRVSLFCSLISRGGSSWPERAVNLASWLFLSGLLEVANGLLCCQPTWGSPSG
ncbi:hypothetical protein E2C01_051999 [Portunus trituberculatus]|uniref:Uncharacterized protein n=1 Tax=Portunus trituberculatus TaxID=210409 RepID=A0A5B7GLW8_PORTR|nr:hypothetical protein [Portunus trituberculatus]